MSRTICNFSKHIDVQNDMRKFWELENVETGNLLSQEEKTCESHFEKTAMHLTNSKFPTKYSSDKLRELFEQAKRRFLSLERRWFIKIKRYHIYIDLYLKINNCAEICKNPISLEMHGFSYSSVWGSFTKSEFSFEKKHPILIS